MTPTRDARGRLRYHTAIARMVRHYFTGTPRRVPLFTFDDPDLRHPGASLDQMRRTYVPFGE